MIHGQQVRVWNGAILRHGYKLSVLYERYQLIVFAHLRTIVTCNRIGIVTDNVNNIISRIPFR
ncbi:hypothetical protein D3C81_2027580 [compost metagenome]